MVRSEKGVTRLLEMARDKGRIRNSNLTAAMAEFLGTFILCLFAVGAGCQAALVQDTFLMPVLGGVIGVMVAITIVGGASGAHINPAVTLGVAVSGGMSWLKVPVYWAAQFLGAYLGSGLAYSLYVKALKTSLSSSSPCYQDITLCPTFAAVFAPSPNGEVGIAFADQVIGTAILVMLILAAFDERNMRIPPFCYGPLFAITIAGINFAFGVNAGGVLNPARDIGARIMAASVGFKAKNVFTYTDSIDGGSAQYWLAPFFGPLVGGALAALLYIAVIAAHLKDEREEKRQDSDNV